MPLTPAPQPFSLEDTLFEGTLVMVGSSGDLRLARRMTLAALSHWGGHEQGVEFIEHKLWGISAEEQVHQMAFERVIGYRAVDLLRMLARCEASIRGIQGLLSVPR